MRAIRLAVMLGGLLAPAVAAQHDHSPYAGMETADGTALTPQEVADLRTGEGMRLALPAELNHHPGPTHVLELADPLGLTPDQRERIALVRDAMRRDAIRVGEEVIALERRLAEAFRDGAADPARVRSATGPLGAARGELRAIHLLAHIETRALLTPGQVEAYDRLRGYAHPPPGEER